MRVTGGGARNGPETPNSLLKKPCFEKTTFDFVGVSLDFSRGNEYFNRLLSGTNSPLVMKYSGSATNLLELEAVFPDGLVKAKLKRIERSQFLLVNRGFHWISEYPFNR